MLVFLIIVLIFLAILTISVCIGLVVENNKSDNECVRQKIPVISIIVPARNEEKNLPALFESLKKQSDLNFEVILIDDRSEDNSLELMRNFESESGIKTKVIANNESPGTCNPKVNVLLKGIDIAEGELFLFTDADCIVGENWVRRISGVFANKKIGIVCGLLTLTGSETTLCRFQNFDHIYRMLYAFGAIGLGHPIGCFGNNLAIRKSVYVEAGGYENLLHSATEDAELISNVKKLKKYIVRAVFEHDTYVETVHKPTWREHANQASRWAAGAIFSKNKFAQSGFCLLMLITTFCIFSILIGFIKPVFFLFPAIMYGYLYISSVLFGIAGKVKKNYWNGLLISVLLYPFIYVQSFIKTLITRTIIWKGTRITWKKQAQR